MGRSGYLSLRVFPGPQNGTATKPKANAGHVEAVVPNAAQAGSGPRIGRSIEAMPVEPGSAGSKQDVSIAAYNLRSSRRKAPMAGLDRATERGNGLVTTEARLRIASLTPSTA